MASDPDLPLILFGGPDRPHRFLRNVLEQLVEQARPGSRIDWSTYYFRDLALASALMRAADRGVRVRLVLEGQARRRGANDAVIELLAAHGLGGGFKVRQRQGGLGQLHTKAYLFSDPDLALVGSFNPSGNQPEDQDVVAEIGDQDRGYNLLFCVRQPDFVVALRKHVDQLGEKDAKLWDRLRPHFNRALGSGSTRAFLYPRLRTRLVESEIQALGRSASVLAAVSHMKKGSFINALRRARRNGAGVSLLVHATERRVPGGLIEQLNKEGIITTRIGNTHDIPMHNKFVILQQGEKRHAWLGSYNYNSKSRWLNDELLVRTEDADAVELLAHRFEQMRAGQV